jgi:hypothetical protein
MLLYLPPYSPDLNPIEPAFNKVNPHLRKASERTIPHLLRRIGPIVADFAANSAGTSSAMLAMLKSERKSAPKLQFSGAKFFSAHVRRVHTARKRDERLPKALNGKYSPGVKIAPFRPSADLIRRASCAHTMHASSTASSKAPRMEIVFTHGETGRSHSPRVN